MDAQTFAANQLENHAKSFLKALNETPEEHFFTDPPAGGHSVAWHALHTADWNRVLVSPKLEGVNASERFAYLGWEDKPWQLAVFGESPASLTDSKAKILEFVTHEFERGVQAIRDAKPAQLEVKVPTPTGEREVMSMIVGQIRHMAYHWGQAKMVALQLAK
jgi:DinB superfamily